VECGYSVRKDCQFQYAYGCLGFSDSRFFSRPIASLVTAMGRETLQLSVDIAKETIGLEVIDGGTDSVMINTRINDPKELKTLEDLGEKVKKEVNRLCKTLELWLDVSFSTAFCLARTRKLSLRIFSLASGRVASKDAQRGASSR